MALELIPLTDHIFLLPGENKGRFPSSHSFLVRDEITILIDTGCGLERVRAAGAEFRPDLIINSHCHPDHSAGNFLLPEITLITPWEGRASHGRLDRLAPRLAAPGDLAEKWKKFATSTMGIQNRPPDEHYRDGHVFDLGRTKLRAILTPGHTVDHYCLFEERSGLLLSFDLDLTRYGPWYGHRESNLADFRASIDRVRALAPQVVASSHRNPIDDGIDDQWESYLAIIDHRAEAILALLAEPRSLSELVERAPIYGGFPYAPDMLRYWEGQMILKHLEELAGAGLVGESGGRWFGTGSGLTPAG